MTLKLVCKDLFTGAMIELFYSVFPEEDVITIIVNVINTSDESIMIEKIYSCCQDFEGRDYDVITLHGTWARERHVQRHNLVLGKQTASSVRGESSHQEHPLMVLCERTATEALGEVYGLGDVYS